MFSMKSADYFKFYFTMIKFLQMQKSKIFQLKRKKLIKIQSKQKKTN